MTPAPDLLLEHGLAVVFVLAFAVQAWMPAPAIPMLLGAGALCGSGRMDLALAVAAAMAPGWPSSWTPTVSRLSTL
jgi:membrane protein DedA with SNARE-associated domain